MAQPIWRDYSADLTPYLTDGVVDFSIELGGSTIYRGRAVAAPDGSCAVRINDICAAFLSQAAPAWPVSPQPLAVAYPPALSATFDVVVEGSAADSVEFIFDWSYNDIVSAYPSGVLSDPVHDWVADGQPLPLTLHKLTGQLTTPGGATSFGDAAADTNTLIRLFDADHPGASYTITAGTWTKTFKLRTDVCWRWGLLYVNAFGGWDFLPMPGTATRLDSFDRTEYERRIDNSVRSARALVPTVNDITRQWTLRTGNLSDAESSRMHHLLASQDVYLFDLRDASLQAVTIADTTCTYKTSRVEKAAVEYAVTVTLAQRRQRR